MEHYEFSPIGVMPRKLHQMKVDYDRLIDLKAAIDRYIEAGLGVDLDWIEEYNELLNKLKDPK